MKKILSILIALLILTSCATGVGSYKKATKVKLTPTPTAVSTRTPTPVSTPTSTSAATPTVPQATSTQAGSIQPYPNAPACLSHDINTFHTLWNDQIGCFYDHEHGQNPFTAEVEAVFPGIQAFLGGVQIGSTNPSSPMENTHKHGGFKWDVSLSPTHGCLAGFEGASYCVTAAVIQYHNFGDYSIEMESRIHSTVSFLRVCDPSNPSDCGEFYTVQHQEYGQRVSPYQGTTIYTVEQGCTVDTPCPINPDPPYDKSLGQYFTIGCVYSGLPGCRTSLNQIRDLKLNADSVWTSKPTGIGSPQNRPPGSTTFKLLFRVRDNYQVLDSRDLQYPFTFAWICTNDNGLTYSPVGCRYTNSSSKVHEVAGVIPSSWDNLPGFDTDPRVGRITANGFTDKHGTLIPECTVAGGGCFPVKLVNMFVGFYGDYLTASKVSFTNVTSNPSRNIWFCNGVVCSEDSLNAVPSGKIGQNN